MTGEGGKNRRAQEGEKGRTKKGGEEARIEARLDAQRLAAALLTIWVTPARCVFCEGSRNTSSAIHFISIPTPASHLHSVSFTSSSSFRSAPLHFLNDNALTLSLAVHRPGHNVTCIQSGGKWQVFVTNMSFSSAPHPQSHISSQVSTSNLPPQSPDQIQICCCLTLTRPCTAQWLPGDPRSDHVSPLHGNK